MMLTWLLRPLTPRFSSAVCQSLGFIGLLALLFVAPVQAQLDPVALINAVRNDKLSAVRTQLSAADKADRIYLRHYAQILLPAIARIGSPKSVDIFIATAGRNNLEIALKRALVMAFENPHPSRMVKHLLELGADPSAQMLGYTALARAAFAHARRHKKGAFDAARLLLAKGANPNAVEDSGMSPLMWACSSDDKPLIKILLSAKADPYVRNRKGRSAALLAKPICKSILNSQVKPLNTNAVAHNITQDPVLLQALYQAVTTSDLKQTTALLQQGISANTAINKSGQNFLALTKDPAIIEALIKHGVDIDWTDSKGWTILHRLVMCPKTANLVKTLLAAGANVHRHIENGQNALLLAHILFVDKLDAKSGQQIIKMLVQAGVDINSSDRDGETLLHLAAYNDAEDLAQIALELGADPQRPNGRGESPLRLATRLKAKAVFQVLTNPPLKVVP